MGQKRTYYDTTGPRGSSFGTPALRNRSFVTLPPFCASTAPPATTTAPNPSVCIYRSASHHQTLAKHARVSYRNYCQRRPTVVRKETPTCSSTGPKCFTTERTTPNLLETSGVICLGGRQCQRRFGEVRVEHPKRRRNHTHPA